MIAKCIELSDESQDEEDLHALGDVSFKRSENTEANGRADEGKLWKADGTRGSSDDRTNGTEFFDERALHFL